LPNESVWLELSDRGWLDKMPTFRGTGRLGGRLDIIEDAETGDWWAIVRGATESCIPLSGVKWKPTPLEPTP
jgi:hypothetical protein